MKQKGYTLLDLLAIVAILAWLTAIGGVVYLAWHFIAKFW